MPIYIYQCADCSSKYDEEQLEKMTEDEIGHAVLFETYHSIKPSDDELDKAVVCPRCGCKDCKISMLGVNVSSYIKGYGWKDYKGARRDMNLYHLKNSDPYSKHRVPGEVDHIESNLKKESKHDPKSKIFVV